MSPHDSSFSAYPLQDFRQYESAIVQAAHDVLRSGNYILGSQTVEFEKEWAAWCGVSHAIGVANGTDAIELLLLGLRIGNGDAVAVPSHTAVASVSAIRRTGADPVYVDIDPDTFTLSPASLLAAIATPVGRRIKAILAVHLYGHPADIPALSKICDDYGLVLLEDGAQAHGASWNGRKTGSLARGAAFSFYPTKNLGAIGDGGAITTDDQNLAARILEIRQYGWRERYISAVEGVNSRLDELQAAILRVKLTGLSESISRRRAIADQYHKGLTGLPGIQLPGVRPGYEHAYHLYVIRSAQRDRMKAELLARGIPAALHYPAAVHQQPGYGRWRDSSPGLEETERAITEILTLPLHPWLGEEAIALVIKGVHETAMPR